MARLLALLSVTFLACSGGSTPPTTPTGGGGDGTGGGTATPVEPALDTAALGQPCGEGGTCGTGASCVKYYGIAGPSGPEFTSCEVTCAGKGACPEGTRCVTVADGPGEVCRADTVAP
ncbi:MAG TPA: hypothetical protein VM261_26665 [Kofleriaceae bacterium]|nr:hypothetical protein [Kofleriaceae bacterium]